MGSVSKSIKKNLDKDDPKAKVIEPEKDNERDVARANADDCLLAFSGIIGSIAFIEFESHVQQSKDWLRANGGTKERMGELLAMHASTCRNNSQTAISILPPIGNAKALVVWLNARISADIVVALDLKLSIDCVRGIQNLAYLNGTEVSDFLSQKIESQEQALPTEKKPEEKPN